MQNFDSSLCDDFTEDEDSSDFRVELAKFLNLFCLFTEEKRNPERVLRKNEATLSGSHTISRLHNA